MNPPKEVREAMARAFCASWGYEWECDPENDQTCSPDGDEVTYCPRPSQAQFKEAADAALSALGEAGYAVVPVSVTFAMETAVSAFDFPRPDIYGDIDANDAADFLGRAWRAMLSASQEQSDV